MPEHSCENNFNLDQQLRRCCFFYFHFCSAERYNLSSFGRGLYGEHLYEIISNFGDWEEMSFSEKNYGPQWMSNHINSLLSTCCTGKNGEKEINRSTAYVVKKINSSKTNGPLVITFSYESKLYMFVPT